jgi:hypothetical protein
MSYTKISDRKMTDDELEAYRKKRREYQSSMRKDPEKVKKLNQAAIKSYNKNKQSRIANQKDKHQSSPWKTMYQTAKRKAMEQSLNFNITPEYLESLYPKDNKCPITRLNFEFGYTNKEKINKNNSPSLDRIIPSKGYVIGNVMIISDLMNRMKQDSTYEDIEKLYNFYKKMKK